MLHGLNDFKRNGSIYTLSDDGSFDYSDGAESEKYLHSVLSNAQDLSSTSAELEAAIRDWPSEYHLSSRRANLFRGFDLDGISTVLELGSGCGAITRFFGEKGLEVGAVEGSRTRAELTALRCRGMQNVSVYCGNFNEITLPEQHYDMIALVGVAEYAARFLGEKVEGQPIVELLTRLREALKPGGVMVLAIENRTGMKYILGAHEDHYGKRFIGIANYFGVQDINTYSLPEWEDILARVGVQKHTLFLPFPDYKLPTVLLRQEFAQNNPHCYCNLEGIESRDYLALFRPEVRESLLWEGAAGSGTMDTWANSFLFVMSFSESSSLLSPAFDFAHLPGFNRRRQYCLVTTKPAGENRVARSPVLDDVPQTSADGFVNQKLIQEPYRRGVLLSVLWARGLEIEPETDRFVSEVRRYIDFLDTRKQISIDLTPSNIIVDENGELHAFDEEWEIKTDVTTGFLLFRSLLILVIKSGNSIPGYAKRAGIQTVRQFIEHVGTKLGVDLRLHIDEYVETEEKFQNSIAEKRSGNPTAALLEKKISEDKNLLVPEKLRVYWKGAGADFHEQNCCYGYAGETDSVQTITISLPPDASRAKRMRFNPCEELANSNAGYLRIYQMELHAVDPKTGKGEVVWALRGAEEIAEHTELTRMTYVKTGLGSIFLVSGDDPWMEFPFIPRMSLKDDQYLDFQVTIRRSRSRDYFLARERYIAAEANLQQKLDEHEETRKKLEEAKNELEVLKASKIWPVVEAYKSARRRIDPLTVKLELWRSLFRNLGFRLTVDRAYRRASGRLVSLLSRTPDTPGPPTVYEEWRDKYFPRDAPAVPDGPLMSVIMPVYNVNGRILRKAVRSVTRQTYANWELCIVDDASDSVDTKETLRDFSDTRIRIKRLDENRNIAGATNTGVGMANGEYIAFMDNDDELVETALSEAAFAFVDKDADCVYTDEDFIRPDNHLDYPHFKPGHNPDLLLSHNFVTHFLVVKRDLFDRVGGFRSDFDGAQDYDFVLRLAEQATNMVHIPKPLYHWRMSETSTSMNPRAKHEGHNNARKALEAALVRRGIEAEVEETRLPHFFRVKRRIVGEPLVSIVVPFRDKAHLLDRCVKTLISNTSYQNYEVVGISNDSTSASSYDVMEDLRKLDSRVRFDELNIEFNFSRLVNYGVEKSNGSHVVLLNNDIELITPEWIENLLEHSQRPEIAAVGAKLYYPNNTVQHAGIAIGLGGYAGHVHHGSRANSAGYFNRLNVVQNVSAVTGALMMVEKRKYREIGMFDEERFKIAYNDVDFCLRAIELGYLNVFTPFVEAYHRESASRGYEDTFSKKARFAVEKQHLLTRHGERIRNGDPYYSRNFDQNRDNFSLFVQRHPTRENR